MNRNTNLFSNLERECSIKDTMSSFSNQSLSLIQYYLSAPFLKIVFENTSIYGLVHIY